MVDHLSDADALRTDPLFKLAMDRTCSRTSKAAMKAAHSLADAR